MDQAADTRRRQLPFHDSAPVNFGPSGAAVASQTLDHHSSHHLAGLQRRETLNLRPYQSEIDKTLREDSNPDPLSFAFSPTSATPPLPPSGTVRYRECLRNHAASVGGNVTDGCCEFMPSGEAGTLEFLKCAACDCHRNFHRKDFEDGQGHNHPTRLLLPAPSQVRGYALVSPVPVNVAYGGGGTDQSSSEDVEGATAPRPEYVTSAAAPGFMMKKRNRTKFTKEQKEKMWEFAERLGWRMQRQNEEDVDAFCEGIGVRRQVFKVWMHNNKNNNSKISYDFAGKIQQQPAAGPDHDVGSNARVVSPETEQECG